MSRCKGCNKEITWAKTWEGKDIPVDTKGPIYQLEIKDGEMRAIKMDEMFGILHFRTCSHANQFSGSNKNQEEK